MTLLMLMLVFLLRNEGIRGKRIHIYQKLGDDAFLPNIQVSLPETNCAVFEWLFYRHNNFIFTDVKGGEVNKESARSSRLRLQGNCSLILSNVTTEDSGLFVCRYKTDVTLDTQVFLNIMTISDSSIQDGEVMLTCTLWGQGTSCEDGSLRWVDERGAELDDEGDGFHKEGQTNCVSYLSVKDPTEHSRRFTCQYVEKTEVKVEVHYTTRSSAPVSDWTVIFIAGGVAGLLVLLLVVAVILLKCRLSLVRVKKDVAKPATSPPEGAEVAYATIDECKTAELPDERESGVTYATVSHSNKKLDRREKVRVEERVEEVTYSAVRTR